MNSQIEFGYWGIRGRGQTGRLLLHYTGADWKDKKYTAPNEWFDKDKKNLGFAFPNLPYLIEGELKITESLAVYRYIINRSDKRGDLFGKNLQDQGRVDCIAGVYEDISKPIFGLLMAEDFEQEKPKAMEKIKIKLANVQKVYGDKQFALGYLTYVDFLFAEFSYYLQALDAAYYANFPFLEKLKIAFNSLPEIQSYYAKEDAVKEPFMPPNAKIQPKLAQ